MYSYSGNVWLVEGSYKTLMEGTKSMKTGKYDHTYRRQYNAHICTETIEEAINAWHIIVANTTLKTSDAAEAVVHSARKINKHTDVFIV